MRKIVVFSGGYDSTLALAEVMAHTSDEDEVIALSFDHWSTGNAKVRREHTAQVLIINQLKQKYPGKKLTHVEVEIKIPWIPEFNGSHSRGLSQPIFWICNLIPLLSDGDQVYLGYIQSDQAMVHLDSIKRMWDAALELQERKNVKLCLPNKLASKAEVLSALINGFPDLVDFCVSCESLNNSSLSDRRCGDCVPCRHMIEALTGLVAAGGNCSTKARLLLNRLYGIDVHIEHLDSRKAEEDGQLRMAFETAGEEVAENGGESDLQSST